MLTARMLTLTCVTMVVVAGRPEFALDAGEAAATHTTSERAAQAPQPAPAPGPSSSQKGAVLKGRAPVSSDVLKVKLPRPSEADLSNGAHLIVLEDRRVPAISFQILIAGAGGYYDPPDHPGLAGFTAAMLREGTTTRSSRQIAEQLETMAAALNIAAAPGSQTAGITGSSLSDNFDAALDLASDVLVNASFPEEELARFKARTAAMLVQQRSNPGFLADELYSRVIYGNHPASRVAPTPESLANTTREALVAFHKEKYAPDHAVVAIAGDISMTEARKVVEARLAGWKKKGVQAPAVVDPQPTGAAKVHFVDRPGSVQTNLVVGTQGIRRDDPAYEVLAVMNKIVGGGPTGRLFLNLREDKGYTYAASSRFAAVKYRGDWQAASPVRSEVTEEALGELLKEVARIRDERVPDQEFSDAKRSMVANFALSLESPNTVLNNHVTRWLYHLPLEYWDTYPERIMAVTQEQVQAVAQKYLGAGRLQIVAVGDGKKIGEVLKKFGPVETYDTDGRPVKTSSP